MSKRILSILLVFLIVAAMFSSVTLSANSQAQSEPEYTKITSKHFFEEVNDWLIDEDNGYLYVYETGVPGPTKINFLRLSDMSVEAVVDLGGFWTGDNGVMYTTPLYDYEIYGTKLYASMSTKLHVIDIKSKSIEKTYELGIKAQDIAVKGNQLFFYADNYVRILDLKTENQRVLDIEGYDYGFKQAKLKTHPNENLLYLAADKLFALNTTDHSIVNVFDEYKLDLSSISNFSVSKKYVYLNSYQLNAYDISKVENIKFFNGSDNFMLSIENGSKLYLSNANTYEKLVEVPIDLFKRYQDIKVDNYGNLYYGISKVTFKNLTPLKDSYVKNKNELKLGKDISAWVQDNNYIYALSNQTNSLLQVNLKTLEVEKETLIGPNPSDIIQRDNLLYISFMNSNKVVKVEKLTLEIQDSISLTYRANQLEIAKNKIFYTSIGSATQMLRVHDLSNNSDNVINSIKYSLTDADMIVDDTEQLLYIGGSGNTTPLLAINTDDYSVIDESWDNDRFRRFSSLSSNLVKYKNDIFVSNLKLNAGELSQVLGEYKNIKYILAASEEIVVSKNTLFDRNTYQPLYTIPRHIMNSATSLAAIDDNMNVYFYNWQSKSIVKIPIESWYTSVDIGTGSSLKDAEAFDFNQNDLSAEISRLSGNEKSYTIKVDTTSNNTAVYIPAESYKHLLMRQQLEFKVISNNGSFVIPMSNSFITNTSSISQVIFQFQKLTGLSSKKIKSVATGNDLEIVSDVFKFGIFSSSSMGGLQVHGRSPNSFMERWVPLPDDVQTSEVVGIYYNSVSNRITTVPTQFITDENGKRWAILKHDLINGIYAVARTNVMFNDINQHWAKEDIELMASKRIVKGISQLKFAPNKNVTRAEYLTFIVRALGLESKSALQPPTTDNSLPYNDVSLNKWYVEPIRIATNAKLASGYPDGSFKPNKPITRQEMVIFTMNALVYVNGREQSAILDSQLKQFKDKSKVANWAKADVVYALHYKFIGGFPDKTFRPNDLATRAQSIAVLKRLMKHLEFIQE